MTAFRIVRCSGSSDEPYGTEEFRVENALFGLWKRVLRFNLEFSPNKDATTAPLCDSLEITSFGLGRLIILFVIVFVTNPPTNKLMQQASIHQPNIPAAPIKNKYAVASDVSVPNIFVAVI